MIDDITGKCIGSFNELIVLEGITFGQDTVSFQYEFCQHPVEDR